MKLKRKLQDYMRLSLLDRADMRSGFQIQSLYLRKMESYCFALIPGLEEATPMGIQCLIADLLVDAASGHKVISFMDGNAWYNQILWQK